MKSSQAQHTLEIAGTATYVVGHHGHTSCWNSQWSTKR